MPFFRRKRPLHERLAEAGGLDHGTPPREPRAFSGFLHDLARLDVVGIHGVHRQREWDAVATAEARLEGDRLEFAALPDGTPIRVAALGGQAVPTAAGHELLLAYDPAQVIAYPVP